MANNIVQRSHDWLQSPHTNLLAWWIPWIAVIAGFLADDFAGLGVAHDDRRAVGAVQPAARPPFLADIDAGLGVACNFDSRGFSFRKICQQQWVHENISSLIGPEGELVKPGLPFGRGQFHQFDCQLWGIGCMVPCCPD